MTKKNINTIGEGAIITNLIDDKFYEVESVSDDTVFCHNKLKEEDKASFSIDAVMGECFRLYVVGKLPTPAKAEYAVVGGILVNPETSEPVTEQGSLKFIEILGTMEGEIILSAKTKDERTDRLDVFSYNPYTDEFKKLINSMGEVKPFFITGYNGETECVFICKTMEPKVLIDSDGNDELDADGNKKTVDTVKKLIAVEYVGKGASPDFRNIFMDVDEVLPGKAGEIVLVGNKIVTDKDGNFVFKTDDIHYVFMDEYFDILYNVTMSSPAKVVDKSPLGRVVISDNELYYENPNYRARRIKSKLCKVLVDYPHLIKADICASKETYTFASDDFKTISITKVITSDRGEIITLDKKEDAE